MLTTPAFRSASVVMFAASSATSQCQSRLSSTAEAKTFLKATEPPVFLLVIYFTSCQFAFVCMNVFHSLTAFSCTVSYTRRRRLMLSR